MHLFVHSFVD